MLNYVEWPNGEKLALTTKETQMHANLGPAETQVNENLRLLASPLGQALKIKFFIISSINRKQNRSEYDSCIFTF